MVKRVIKMVGKSLEKANDFKKNVRNHMITAVTAAFALIIGLAWKDAIYDIVVKIAEIFPFLETPYLSSLITAFVVTIICVIGITIVSRLNK